MNLDSHILKGFEILKNQTVTLDDKDIDCVFDNSTYRDKKTFGFEAQDSSIITVRTKDLTTDSRNHLKKLVTINGSQWEIIATQKGSATCQFTLVSLNTL